MLEEHHGQSLVQEPVQLGELAMLLPSLDGSVVAQPYVIAEIVVSSQERCQMARTQGSFLCGSAETRVVEAWEVVHGRDRIDDPEVCQWNAVTVEAVFCRADPAPGSFCEEVVHGRDRIGDPEACQWNVVMVETELCGPAQKALDAWICGQMTLGNAV